MNIPGDFLEIILSINQKGFISALIKMSTSLVLPIVIRSIGNIEIPHEFLEVAPGVLTRK